MPVDIRQVTPRGRALAAALREMRIRRGISGRELGKRLGLSHSAISHWETGRRIPSPEEAASVLTALGVVGVEKHRLIELARHAGDPNWFSVGWTGIEDRAATPHDYSRLAWEHFLTALRSR
jgi:transcriptional regulator with XRE-family HTH domain